MVRVTDELALSPEHVTLYQAPDPLLGHLPVLVFHGSSTTANYTLNSSRVQVHIYSPAGFQYFPRLTISPNSPFYGVVNYLPREFQGDEVYRGLAFGLFKYFTELHDGVKAHLRTKYPSKNRRPGSAPELFGEQHAADLAQSMIKSDFTADAIRSLQAALQTQHISNVDVDFVLPPGAIVPLRSDEYDDDEPDNEDDILDPSLRQYSCYTPLVKLLGEPIFLPTTKLRRAPSRPTSLNRSKSFTRDQRQDLRMKLGELVETEERYVAKLTELVRHVAEDFRDSAKKKAPGSLSPSEEELKQLFPKSADQILLVNSAFCHEMRKALDEAEAETDADADGNCDHGGVPLRLPGTPRPKDPTGALAIAKIFLDWFPKFTDCYQDYIRASQHFPHLLNSFLDQQSSFRQRVNQTGEQAIRSVLIEPVQRLPRYSLLIDQIVGCLPMTHPALQPMLRSRDIITNICSMDDPMPDKPHLAHRLRNLVESWPEELEPRGRLVMAVDFAELPPPFVPSDDLDRAGMFLIFTDCIVMVNKLSAKFTGRDLLREVDKPSPAGLLMSMTNAAGGTATYDLSFGGWHDLADVRFTESSDGQHVWMTSTKETKGEPGTSRRPTSRFFRLQETFVGKASRFTEDVVKARVEARFAEAEREDPCWTLRSVRMRDSSLGLYAAVFQEGADQLIAGRREPAPVRIVIDHERGTKGAPVGHYGVEIAVDVSTAGGSMRRLSMITAGLNGKQYADEVDIDDFLPTLSRRIMQLLSSQFGVANANLTPALVAYNTKVIKCLTFTTRAEKTRSFLGTSPVKLLSNLWNGTTDSGGSKHARTPVASLFPPAPAIPRSNSQNSVNSANGSGSRIIVDHEMPENPLVRLEQTFTGYVAALQARKGAIIGRSLMNRSGVDELTVNDLYNRLIESPYDLDASSDVSVEVVFVAFEKFLQVAWREQMGLIMTMQALDTLLERLNKRVPGDFADFVNFMFGDMAPQNRRAFTALIKLLTDLLEGCGNDGDRGALTIAFAELLVTNGTAHNYINLLDRLVEDCDRIFEEAVPFGAGFSASVNSGYGYAYALDSMGAMGRGGSRSQNGSVTSNASSLRRKLGFDTLLMRQNSNKNDDRPSMWRSLSKHNRTNATAGDASQNSSISKSSVNRSRSIDMGHPSYQQQLHQQQQQLLLQLHLQQHQRQQQQYEPPFAHSPQHSPQHQHHQQHQQQPIKLRRPNSRDRPPLSGPLDDWYVRPGSGHQPLETIGEPDGGEMAAAAAAPPPEPPKPGKKKRRSSLSDLRTLLDAATLEGDAFMHHSNHSDCGGNVIANGVSTAFSASTNAATARLDANSNGMSNGTANTSAESDQALMPLRINKQLSGKFNSASPKNGTPPLAGGLSRIPVSPGSLAMRSPRQKENMADPLQLTPPHLDQQQQHQHYQPPPLSSSPPKKHTKTMSLSNIPTLKHSRSAAMPSPSSPDARPSTSRGLGISGSLSRPAGPQRLRLQSAQRLRERMQSERAAAEEVDASLQSELSRIAEDMARLHSSSTPPLGGLGGVGTPRSSSLDTRKLSVAVRSLEDRIPAVLHDMAERQQAMQRDVDSSLRASDAKVKAIDQLYKEATAENELLYEKFNSELARIVKAVKGKTRDDRDDIMGRLVEQSEESARLKKENARLKREMASLRAALGGAQAHRSES